MSLAVGLELAERGLVPAPALRWGIRRLLAERLREPVDDAFLAALPGSPVAPVPEKANEQHYELPPAFFEHVLGRHLKYSCALWPDGVDSLDEAEAAMLALTCERAGIEDGQEILELGCGWGSLSLWMAERYPNSRILAVSNSHAQRRFLDARAPSNLSVVTADMNDFATAAGRFHRVVSVEMFEHMRNHAELMRRIAGWLRPEGRLFVHVFCHRSLAYPFETEGADNWMGRHFFTGGIMPSADLLPRHRDDLVVEERWEVPGEHYRRTAEAWRERLEARRSEIAPILAETYGVDARRWYHRWRIFFLACAELFGYGGGAEWFVAHYRFRRR